MNCTYWITERDNHNCRLYLPRESIRCVLCSVLFDVASAKSFRHKPLLQALQIRISDQQRSVLLTFLTYFSLGARDPWYFQRFKLPRTACRLSYPCAVLRSCANEMNGQSAANALGECKTLVKKTLRISICLTSFLFIFVFCFFWKKIFNFHS